MSTMFTYNCRCGYLGGTSSHGWWSKKKKMTLLSNELLLPILLSHALQDAQEYFLHLLGTVDKQQRVSSPGNGNPADAFRFQLEDRIQCSSSGKVQYSHRDDFILQLPVPMEAATNKGNAGESAEFICFVVWHCLIVFAVYVGEKTLSTW